MCGWNQYVPGSGTMNEYVNVSPGRIGAWVRS